MVRAIRASDATTIVMVAKHHDGFALWPTAQTGYSIKASPWKNGKGDMLAEIAAAARRNGLRIGVYLSPWDRHEPKLHRSETQKSVEAVMEERDGRTVMPSDVISSLSSE